MKKLFEGDISTRTAGTPTRALCWPGRREEARVGVQLESRGDSKKVVEWVNGKARERNNRDVVG